MENEAGSGRLWRPQHSMNQAAQKKRTRNLAIILGLVAIAFYLGFIWATANGF